MKRADRRVSAPEQARALREEQTPHEAACADDVMRALLAAERRLSEAQSDRADAERYAGALAAKLATREQQIEQLTTALGRLEAELEAVTAELAASKRHLAALLASTSWRVTAPMRAIMGRIRAAVRWLREASRRRATAQAGVGPKRKAPRKSTELSQQERKRLEALFDKASSGFRAAAIRDLEALVISQSRAAVRHAAAMRLATIYADSADEEELRRAVALLDSAGPGNGEGRRAWITLRLASLLRLGRLQEAEALFSTEAARVDAHPDVLLLGANLLARFGAPGRLGAVWELERVGVIARAFGRSAGVGFAKADPEAPLSFENLAAPLLTATRDGDEPLVSIIMPAYNCADHVETSIRSILNQSWTRLELIVCDDASTDETPHILAQLQAEDDRIKIIRLRENSGAYVARNHGLAAARGEFVTCQDADDWSHPERIRRQVSHLLANPSLIANVSHCARASEQLEFLRRPHSTRVIHFNSSSIMFRREPTVGRIGYWDSVRFGGDTEFWHRLRSAFGSEATGELPQLLAITRVRDDSLTRSLGSEYGGGKIGARKAYFHAYSIWHERAKDNLYVPFPLVERPFGVPHRMLPHRPQRHEYDVVTISDFRHQGGNTVSSLQELTAQARAGLRSAIVQVDRYDFSVARTIHPDVQTLIDAGAVDVIVHGDRVKAKLVILRYPPVFGEPPSYLPVIDAEDVRVVVNQPPRRVEGEAPFYSIETCKRNIRAYLGTEGEWVPIGPAVRRALDADNEGHHLSPEDWFNVIDIDHWHVERKSWIDRVPVIGRHGRDSFEKWPTSPSDILAAYPDDGSMRVRVLGGANVPAAVIGRVPATWEVFEFNEIHPREFLAGIDFFVYFPHDRRIEAFGRTIIEAMAAGCLAVLHPMFAELFGDAAVYCAPHEVRSVVQKFYDDRDAYERQVNHAYRVVRSRFGFEQHIERIRRIFEKRTGDKAIARAI